MVGFIVSIILLILAISCHKKTGCWYSPGALFMYLWTLIVFFSSLHLFGMYKVSDKMNLMTLLGSIAFYLGSYKNQIPSRDDAFVLKEEQFISREMFFLLAIILIALQVKPFMLSLALQTSGVEMNELREEFFEQSKSGLELISDITLGILNPILEAYGITMFIKNVKKNILYIILVFLLVGMKSVISGGRWDLFFIMAELFICFSIFKRNKLISFSTTTKILALSFIVILVGGIAAITVIRLGENAHLTEHFYMYFCGNMVFCDQRISLVESWPLYPFGAGIRGFWYLVFTLLHFFGISSPQWYLELDKTVLTTQDFMTIGDGMYFNAYSTPFYWLYADSRWIGVFFGMFIWAKISSSLYRRMLIDRDTKSIVFFILSCQMILSSIFAYPLVNIGYVSLLLFYAINRNVFHHR